MLQTLLAFARAARSCFQTQRDLALENLALRRSAVQSQAFPEQSAPKYLVPDRDAIFGEAFRRRIQNMGIEQVVTAARSPWQNPFCERLVGSVRRECLEHVIVLGENHLRAILREYFAYYHRWRTHLSLAKDCPEPRAVQGPTLGKVFALPQVGGLHHGYVRRAA